MENPIKEIKERKEKLKKDLYYLLNEFSKDVGEIEYDISIRTETVARGGTNEKVIAGIAIDIELKL